jgi:hypothetical protein
MRLACEIGGTFTHRLVEDDDRIKGMGVIPAATRAIMTRPSSTRSISAPPASYAGIADMNDPQKATGYCYASATLKMPDTADVTIGAVEGVLGGGHDGRTRVLNRQRDGRETVLPTCYGVTLKPGGPVISYSAGGGGYGSPLGRDPVRVLHDPRDGWISAERAHDVYGVITVGA